MYELILCQIVWIIILPVIILLTPLFFILVSYKIIVNIIVKFFHPNWIPFTALDNGVMFITTLYKSEGKILENIGALVEINENVDIEAIKEHFTNNILNLKTRIDSYQYDRLRKYPVKFMGHYYWSDEYEQINLNNFIAERRVEKTDLREFMAHWLHEGYPENTPMWQIVVYKDDDEYQGKSCFLFKMSHCVGDGMSVRNILSKCLQYKENMTLKSNDKKWVTTKEKIMFSLMFPLLSWRQGRHKHPDKDWNKVSYLTEATISLTKVNVDLIKEIRRAPNCKFNDVLLGIIGNALRRYILKTNPNAKLPELMTMFVTLMVPPHPDTLCNQATRIFVEVPMENSNLSERFQNLCERSRKEYSLKMHKFEHMSLGSVYYLPHFFNRFMSKQMSVGANVSLCSFPGADECSSAFGIYTVNSVYPITGLTVKQKGLVVACGAVGKDLNISLTGNKGIFLNQSDMDILVTYFHEELDALYGLTKEKNNYLVNAV